MKKGKWRLFIFWSLMTECLVILSLIIRCLIVGEVSDWWGLLIGPILSTIAVYLTINEWINKQVEKNDLTFGLILGLIPGMIVGFIVGPILGLIIGLPYGLAGVIGSMGGGEDSRSNPLVIGLVCGLFFILGAELAGILF